MDNEALLRSLEPGSAWITIAVMWVEIAALVAALIRRYQLRSHSLRLPIAVAIVALVLNGIGVVIFLPAIVLG
jgi:CHASE2 domain-containing sensor protein